MDRIGVAGGLPLQALANGQQGFIDEDLSIGQEGTDVNAAWLNALQETLMHPIQTGAEIGPNLLDFTQLTQAIVVLANSAIATYPGASGWQKLTGGLILQYGTSVTTDGYQDYFAFPVAFPNNVLAIVISEISSSGWGAPPNAPVPTIYGTNRVTGANALLGMLVSSANITPGGPAYHGGGGFSYLALGN